MSSSILSPSAVEYPSSDGKPMAENDAQGNAIRYAIGSLRNWFADRPEVYVAGDLLIYYEEGNPKASVAPDTFVVFGAGMYFRETYKLWEEPKAPDFALEVASENTWREHEGCSREIYERLGIREYWQYDPTGEYLGVRLKGHRLVEGAYTPQPVLESVDGRLILSSETLGLDLCVRGEEMYFQKRGRGKPLLSHREAVEALQNAESRFEREAAARWEETAARRKAEFRLEQEATARRAAEARVAELEALVARKS